MDRGCCNDWDEIMGYDGIMTGFLFLRHTALQGTTREEEIKKNDPIFYLPTTFGLVSRSGRTRSTNEQQAKDDY